MAYSSSCFVIVFVAVLLQFLLVSSSTKPIDAICQKRELGDVDTAFCIKTLSAYPRAASANSTLQAARATLHLGLSHARKSVKFIEKAAMENPKLKKQFMECQKEYVRIETNLWSAGSELTEDPETASYDAEVSLDNTSRVEALVGKNIDEASKTIMNMTLMMDKLINIAFAAAVAVRAKIMT